MQNINNSVKDATIFLYKNMKILILLLFLFIPTTLAFFEKPQLKCSNVLEFVEVLVPTENRNALIGRWRGFLNYNLRNNAITIAQYDERKTEILEAKRIIDELEAQGYKDNEVVGLAYHRYCSV